jgi:hypothetical protein
MDGIPFDVVCAIAGELARSGYVRYCVPLSCVSTTMRDAARSAKKWFALVIRPELARSADRTDLADLTARTIASVRPAHIVFYEARLFLRALDPVDPVAPGVLETIETAWYRRGCSYRSATGNKRNIGYWTGSHGGVTGVTTNNCPMEAPVYGTAHIEKEKEKEKENEKENENEKGTWLWKECVRRAHNATDVAVPECDATDADVDEILVGRARTHRLCVSGNASVTRLPRASVCATLVELRIASTSIGDLAPLVDARRLRVLDASNTRVCDLTPVEKLMEAGTLRAVNIAYTPVTSIARVCATTVVDPRMLDMAFLALRGIMRAIKDPVCEVTPKGWALWSSLAPLDTFVSVEVTD